MRKVTSNNMEMMHRELKRQCAFLEDACLHGRLEARGEQTHSGFTSVVCTDKLGSGLPSAIEEMV